VRPRPLNARNPNAPLSVCVGAAGLPEPEVEEAGELPELFDDAPDLSDVEVPVADGEDADPPVVVAAKPSTAMSETVSVAVAVSVPSSPSQIARPLVSVHTALTVKLSTGSASMIDAKSGPSTRVATIDER
jgi:hypothetical protein